ELLVAALLAALGGLTIVDAVRMPTDFAQRGPVGPKALPVVIGVALLGIAVLLAADVLRGGHGEAEAGEDIDLASRADWRTLALLAAALLANAALIDVAGWPVSGAVLFWGAAYALGSRYYLRDPLIALTLSVGSYLGLYQLGVILPGGPLEGVLMWTA
ncbi:MAG: tripartite tricarboxylate transporter TctB family protein, partial [Micromonosporaceae bacterium]